MDLLAFFVQKLRNSKHTSNVNIDILDQDLSVVYVIRLLASCVTFGCFF